MTGPTLSSIDEKLDDVIMRMDKILDDHEKRLRFVERIAYSLTGVVSFCVFAVGIVSRWVPWGFLSKNK